MSNRSEREECEAVIWFGKKMAEKLRKNGHKSHWRASTFAYLTRRMLQEVVELLDELEEPTLDVEAIAMECADIANFAMMIADNARRRTNH